MTTPTDADETRFWSLIEQAWAPLGAGPAGLRARLATRDPEDPGMDVYALDTHLPAFLDNLTRLCADLPAADLTALDRADVQAVTDGSVGPPTVHAGQTVAVTC